MHKKKILLIDDEVDILEMLSYNLEKEGYLVATATNGNEGIQKAKEMIPDLILLDINIPILSGHEVLAIIKEDEYLKKIPVIMLTTSSCQGDIEKAYNKYCNSYIQKPLEMEEFVKAVLKIEEFWLQLTTLSK